MSCSLLLTLQGKEDATALEALTQVLEGFPLNLCNIHHQTLHGVLSASYLLAQQEPFSLDHLDHQLQALAQELGWHIELIPNISPEASSTALAQQHGYVFTTLAKTTPLSTFHDLLQCLQQRFSIQSITPLDHEDWQVYEWRIFAEQLIEHRQFVSDLLDFKEQHAIDFALQSNTLFRRHKRLIVFDVDMTFLQCETIDELSRLTGKGEEVRKITEQAMDGKLDFEEALIRRVATLEGLKVEHLDTFLKDLPYTPGIQRLVNVLKALGYKIAIVSGGFDFLIDHIQEQFDLDYGYANTLEKKGDALTGRVIGDIVDSERKATLLEEMAQRENITLEQVIAVGDGANDVEMLTRAGLGIAFNAKPFLQQHAEANLSQSIQIDVILYFLGISKKEMDHYAK